ncbi:MAG: hypothetical protein HOW97_39665 [Catenulispora sp.]|nr:hypothetical protein [Catenulispora sp.]NUS29146.1 hypothetical protein [Streptomyces sp.]
MSQTRPAPPAAIATLRTALDKATLVDDNPAYILGQVLNALSREGWQITPAGTTEDARARLWLIQQVLQRIDASHDPYGIVGDIGVYLDGPIHPSNITAFRAAQEA